MTFRQVDRSPKTVEQVGSFGQAKPLVMQLSEIGLRLARLRRAAAVRGSLGDEAHDSR